MFEPGTVYIVDYNHCRYHSQGKHRDSEFRCSRDCTGVQPSGSTGAGAGNPVVVLALVLALALVPVLVLAVLLLSTL